MHQEEFISVFSDILYDDHSPSVVMIIVGRALSNTLFFCVSLLKYCARSYNLFYVDIIIYL